MNTESHLLPQKMVCVFREIVKKQSRRVVRRKGSSSQLSIEKDWSLVDRRNVCRYSNLSGRSDVAHAGRFKSYNEKKLRQIIVIEGERQQRIRGWTYNKPNRRGPYKEYLSNLELHAWLRKYAGDETANVLAFCQKYRILQELKAAINLAKKIFPSLRKLSVGISRDPEWETEKVVLSATLGCGSEEAFAAYDKYVSEWIDTAGWEARKRFCLSYGII